MFSSYLMIPKTSVSLGMCRVTSDVKKHVIATVNLLQSYLKKPHGQLLRVGGKRFHI